MTKTNLEWPWGGVDYKVNLGGCDRTPISYINVLLPWNRLELEGWSIVGMNHYHIKGIRHLFCAMVNEDGKCIKAEGHNEAEVFESLAKQAYECI